MSTVRKAEDDDAFVVRFYDAAGEPRTVALRGPRPIAGARRTDLLERGGESLPVEGGVARQNLGACAIETVRLPLAPQGP